MGDLFRLSMLYVDPNYVTPVKNEILQCHRAYAVKPTGRLRLFQGAQTMVLRCFATENRTT